MDDFSQFERMLRGFAGLDSPALGRGVLERAVRRRIEALHANGLDDYRRRLEGSTEEAQQLIDEVVVLETSFFRDAGAFTALQDWVTREWMTSSRAARTLNVLSVPSSTGEEPYTIAMALLDLQNPSLRFRVDAIDISMRALRRARAGVYGSGSFRGKQLDYRDRYFTRTAEGFSINDDVRERVDFRRGNVLEELPSARQYDVVFCRNLLIYFDADHQQRAMLRLMSLVARDGVLFLGPAETFLATGLPLRSLGKPMSFGFIRVDDVAAATAPQNATRVTSRPHRTNAIVKNSTKSSATRAVSPAASTPRRDPVPTSDPTLLDEAENLANAGRLADAATVCAAHIKANGPSARALFLQGVVADALGDRVLAITSFRKVLYLEPAHEQARLHLAMILRASGGGA